MHGGTSPPTLQKGAALPRIRAVRLGPGSGVHGRERRLEAPRSPLARPLLSLDAADLRRRRAPARVAPRPPGLEERPTLGAIARLHARHLLRRVRKRGAPRPRPRR